MSLTSFLDNLFGERILGSVAGVEWHNREWGEMTISRGEVCIQNRKTSFFFGTKKDVGLRIPMVLIASTEIDTEQRMVIHWFDQDDNSIEEIIVFKKQGDLGVIAAALGRALKELGEESRQAQMERAERLQRQKEERSRQEESLRVEQERELVWKTVGEIWAIVRELTEIIVSLPGEDWRTIDASWRMIRNIGGKTVLDLSLAIDSFMPALESRSADEMYKDTLTFIRLLSDSVKGMVVSRMEEEYLAIQYESFPQWRHVPYFLMFALTYSEIVLCHRAGDVETIGKDMVQLRSMARVLQEEFSMSLEEPISLFAAGLETGDSNQVRATGRALEEYINDTTMKRVGSG